MQGKKNLILIISLLIYTAGYSQYHISGYIKTKEKNKIIYLSLLKYNEENAIYSEQVLTTTKTDSTGYFEISGKLLSDENKLYRIHSNKFVEGPLLEFIQSGANKNHHHFIFSNYDTIFFPKGEYIWFSKPKNTNAEDKQWRKAIDYEMELLSEYSLAKNNDGIIQAEKKYLSEYKSYASDSLSGSLAKLMVFAHLSRDIDLSKDYQSNPKFYNKLLKDLEEDYSGTSYYSQYQAKLSELSASIIKEKFTFHKRLNYVLIGITLILSAGLIYLTYKYNKKKSKELSIELSTLTAQEEKVARLIFEGKSNKEIASELFVCQSTIKSHISNINSKLNTSNRKQLVGKLKNQPGY